LYYSQNNRKSIFAGTVAIAAMFIYSCSPAKYVPEGNYLLSKNKIETEQKVVPEDQLKGYVIQKPNKRILGVRFHLFLYNLSNLQKTRWPHNWLRRIGEEPVVFNPTLTNTSAQQLRQFLENKGYYHAAVRDTVLYGKKNARVTYHINPDEPYRVRSIAYFFEDTSLMSIVLPDTLNSLLHKKMRFDKDVLQHERVRIETLLKEHGYFRFSKEYIYYQATLIPQANAVDLVMRFKEYVEGRPDPRTKVKYHPKYLIRNVYVYPDYNPLDQGIQSGSPPLPFDTTLYNDQYFVKQGKTRIRPSVIVNASYIIPGQYYKLSNVNRTYKNLSELGITRYTNITFKEIDSLSVAGSDDYLDCRIEMTQKKVQSYQAEVAGTNSAGDLGIRGNITYQNLNLFKGAEVFNLRLTGAVEALKNRSNKQYTSMQEIGIEANVLFPKFFSPFRLEGFVKKYAPKTSISLSYNYQSRPDYTRSIANGSFSYRWKPNQYHTHTVWPTELNYVQIYEGRSSQDFIDSIKTTPIGYSFEDHMVNMARYGFELNNQTIGRSRDFVFLHLNIESAGNIVNWINSAFAPDSAKKPYQVFNVPYFQYLRGDIDLRYYNIIDRQNRFVYRLYLGVGYPYGNSRALPYEKKFFSGGPNSIRAWSTRELGPGSYKDTSSGRPFLFLNNIGDIKLEANIEYRFKVVWKMEGAIFIDMGNIWAIRPEEDKPGALFEWNRFYKEIAFGTGFGARFDFSFFLLRLDFGIKLRDPSLPENSRWIPVFRDFGLNDLHVKFGIGYPF
jgi:outer membrane protein assembly factor BamA